MKKKRHSRPEDKVVKRVAGYGVFVAAYGGLIGFSKEYDMANKLARTEYAEVSISRSLDDFKVRPVTISYSLHSKRKQTVKSKRRSIAPKDK